MGPFIEAGEDDNENMYIEFKDVTKKYPEGSQAAKDIYNTLYKLECIFSDSEEAVCSTNESLAVGRYVEDGKLYLYIATNKSSVDDPDVTFAASTPEGIALLGIFNTLRNSDEPPYEEDGEKRFDVYAVYKDD